VKTITYYGEVVGDRARDEWTDAMIRADRIGTLVLARRMGDPVRIVGPRRAIRYLDGI
jgi:hypothetical protein